MTTETFWFCADLSMVKTWWEQPIEATIKDMATLKIGKFPGFWGLLDESIIQSTMIPELESLKNHFGDLVSLSQACKIAIEEAATPIKPRWKNTLPWMRRKIRVFHFGRIARFGDIYTGLILASRRGPVNEPLETRVVDYYFSTWLEQFMPQSEARLYNESLLTDVQYSYPPEYRVLNRKLIRDLEMYVPFPHMMNAEEWFGKMKRVNEIPELWDALKGDVHLYSKILHKPNLKSYNRETPLYAEIVKKYAIELGFNVSQKPKDDFLMLGMNQSVSNERVIKYLKDITDISKYAIDNSLQLMKITYV